MITVERVTGASAERLWGLVGDLENWDRILPTMQDVTRVDGEGPVTVGARFEVRQPGLPRAVYEITAWQPDRGFTWVQSAPGVRTTATHAVATEDGQTRLTLGIAWSGPLAGIVRLLLGAKARRMVEQEADTFVRLAEAGDDGGVGE